MYREPNIESSYQKNDLGLTLYSTIRMLKPQIIVDFGVLYGYSTIAMAQALKDNGSGKIISYDIFDDYEFKNAKLDILEKEIIK